MQADTVSSPGLRRRPPRTCGRMLVRLAVAGGSTRNSCSWYARSGLDCRPGSIQWLACGHFVDLQLLIYEAARRCGGGYYAVVKNNISICRAETCYQVVSVLRRRTGARAS